jgi:hypothetical protein
MLYQLLKIWMMKWMWWGTESQEVCTNKRGQCTYNVTLNQYCRGKAISVTYWSVCTCCVCVRACWYPGAWTCACTHVHLSLPIQHGTRMRHVVTSYVALRSPPHFSTLSHKRCDFREKKKKTLFSIKCVLRFSLQLLFKTFPILRLIYQDIGKKCRNIFM